jgi:hypothetical protein
MFALSFFTVAVLAHCIPDTYGWVEAMYEKNVNDSEVFMTADEFLQKGSLTKLLETE